MDELKYWIWLATAFNYGSDKPRLLLEHFEGPKQIYDASEKELISLGFVTKRELVNLSDKSLKDAENIIADCVKNKIKIVTYSQKLYPNKLRNIFGAPMVLYYFGDISLLNEQVTITVVGTRKADDYGKTVTCNMAMQLSLAGVLIISGCAVGIDTFAHKGALMAGGKTVSVLGCGLTVNYPSENFNLKREIIKHGALISELPPKTAVNGKYFPVRNRILAGLADGVLVTQAPSRSGSLITAEHAIEQGKDLFCIPPADIYSNTYSGVKRYIRDGAITVCDVEDILREYENVKAHTIRKTVNLTEIDDNITVKKEKSVVKKPVEPCLVVYKDKVIKEDKIPDAKDTQAAWEFDEALSEECKKVYETIGDKELHINDISELTGIKISKLLAVLTELELAGMIIAMSGRRYKRA